MEHQSTVSKIWSVIYPPLLYLAVSIFVQAILSSAVVAFHIDSTVLTLISAILMLFILSWLFNYKPNFKEPKLFIIHYSLFIELIALAITSSLALNRLLNLLPINHVLGDYEEVQNYLLGGSVFINVLTIAIVVPVLEEIIFRGIVYNRLKLMMGRNMAVITASIMFGVYHMNLLQGIYAFLFSLLFIFVYEKYHNIIAPILMHMVANGLSVFLTYTKINEFFNKKLVVYIMVMLLEFIITGIIIFIVHKRQKSNVGDMYV